MSELLPDDRAAVADFARNKVRAGYEDEAEIREAVEDFLSDLETPPADESMRAIASDLVAEEIATLQTEQVSWPEQTDYDRLQRALLALEAEGIVARQNFTCCGTCGAYEIGEEIEEYERGGTAARGYVFFHQQDTESAVEYGSLCFNYGAAKEEDEASNVAIGRELVKHLTAVGLRPEWDGDWGRRVLVSLDWKRRWPQ